MAADPPPGLSPCHQPPMPPCTLSPCQLPPGQILTALDGRVGVVCGGSGNSPVSPDGKGAPYIRRNTDKPGGSAGSSQSGQGPIIRGTGAGVPYPGEMGESGEVRGAQRAGECCWCRLRTGNVPNIMMAPKQHIPCRTLQCAHSSQLRATGAHTTVCQG